MVEAVEANSVNFPILLCSIHFVSLHTVITHPLAGACFRCKISRLRQYRTATALKVIIAEAPVVRQVAKPFWPSLLERYSSEAEHLSNELGSAI